MARTLAQVQASLVLWYAAEDAAAAGRSYTIGDRQLTRNDLSEIRAHITYLERREAALEASASGSSKPASLACWNGCNG